MQGATWAEVRSDVMQAYKQAAWIVLWVRVDVGGMRSCTGIQGADIGVKTPFMIQSSLFDMTPTILAWQTTSAVHTYQKGPGCVQPCHAMVTSHKGRHMSRIDFIWALSGPAAGKASNALATSAQASFSRSS